MVFWIILSFSIKLVIGSTFFLSNTLQRMKILIWWSWCLNNAAWELFRQFSTLSWWILKLMEKRDILNGSFFTLWLMWNAIINAWSSLKCNQMVEPFLFLFFSECPLHWIIFSQYSSTVPFKWKVECQLT